MSNIQTYFEMMFQKLSGEKSLEVIMQPDALTEYLLNCDFCSRHCIVLMTCIKFSTYECLILSNEY